MLTPAQVEHYHTEGYVAVSGFLSAEEIAAFLSEMDAASTGNTLADHRRYPHGDGAQSAP